jgi:chromosome segregation ATPase
MDHRLRGLFSMSEPMDEGSSASKVQARITQLDDALSGTDKAVVELNRRISVIEKSIGVGNLLDQMIARLDAYEDRQNTMSDRINELNFEYLERFEKLERRLVRGGDNEPIEEWTDRQLEKLATGNHNLERRCGQLDEVVKKHTRLIERYQDEMERMSENFTKRIDAMAEKFASRRRVTKDHSKRIDALGSRLGEADAMVNPEDDYQFSPPVGGREEVREKIVGIEAMKRETYERGFSAGKQDQAARSFEMGRIIGKAEAEMKIEDLTGTAYLRGKGVGRRELEGEIRERLEDAEGHHTLSEVLRTLFH